MMDGLAEEAAAPKTVMIDATDLKAHRTATSLRSKKGVPATSGAVRSAERKGSGEKETVQWAVSPENGTPSCMPSPMPTGARSGGARSGSS